MLVAFNSRKKSYKRNMGGRYKFSSVIASKRLTPDNISFLKSLGLELK